MKTRTASNCSSKTLRTLRFQQNLTQEELARRCGITRQQISRIEVDGHLPSMESIRRLEMAMELEPGSMSILYAKLMKEEGAEYEGLMMAASSTQVQYDAKPARKRGRPRKNPAPEAP